MKRSPLEQLKALIEGMALDQSIPMEDLLKKPPKYFRQVGHDTMRLAQIGFDYIEKMKLEAAQKELEAAAEEEEKAEKKGLVIPNFLKFGKKKEETDVAE